MFFKKKKTMQEQDFKTPNEQDINRDLSQEEQAMAHGLNTDDSVSESGFFQTTEEQEAANAGKELEEAKDKYLRLAAEFDNYKRRTAKERMELLQTAGKDVIQELLPVLDDMDRAEAMSQNSNDPQALREGFELVLNKLRNTLNRMGLSRMEAHNTPFDADLHEAITEIPAASPEQQGAVMDVIEPGYYLNDKLIRHAKVVVGK